MVQPSQKQGNRVALILLDDSHPVNVASPGDARKRAGHGFVDPGITRNGRPSVARFPGFMSGPFSGRNYICPLWDFFSFFALRFSFSVIFGDFLASWRTLSLDGIRVDLLPKRYPHPVSIYRVPLRRTSVNGFRRAGRASGFRDSRFDWRSPARLW